MKFCTQCGTKISSDTKFCPNCGHDLIKSSSKTSLDANVKVETTNATVEKGFKTVEKGVKATGKGLLFSLTTLKKTIKPIITLLVFGAILYGVAFIGFMLQESYLKKDRDRALQDLKLKIEATQGDSIVDEWEVLGSDDPASGKKIGRYTNIRSNNGLCSMSVEHRIDGTKLTGFRCDFNFDVPLMNSGFTSIKFDNDRNIQTMNYSAFKNSHDKFNLSGTSAAYFSPELRLKNTGEFSHFKPEYLFKNTHAFGYKDFISGLISANTVAIQITPTVDHGYYKFYNYATGTYGNFERLDLDPVWIKFSLKGAKEAIAKLGKELR
jgi:hypothetical protein